MDSDKGIYVTASETTGDLTATQSVFSAVPKKKKKLNTDRKFLSVSIPEKAEVERLDLWSRSGFPSLPSQVPQNPTLYRARFSDFDRVLSHRKMKSQLPAFIRKSEGNKTIKQLDDLDKKEKSRCAKLYEEELTTKRTELETKLKYMMKERNNARETNFILKKALEPVVIVEKIEKKKGDVAQKRRNAFLNPSVNEDNAPVGTSKVEEKSEAEKKEILTEIDRNSHRIAELEVEIKSAKQQLKVLKGEEIGHFGALLKEGVDSRSEGLAWVVVKLWELGTETPREAFPGYLEEETVEVILTIAHKLKQLRELVAATALQERQHRRASITARAHPDRWNNVQTRLKSLVHTISVQQASIKAAKSVSPSPVLGLTPPPSTLQRLKMQIEEIKSEVAALQTREMRRLLHESCFRQWEKRTGVSVWQVLGAILGSEVVARQMSWITKEQMRLLEEQTRTKTYCFA